MRETVQNRFDVRWPTGTVRTRKEDSSGIGTRCAPPLLALNHRAPERDASDCAVPEMRLVHVVVEVEEIRCRLEIVRCMDAAVARLRRTSCTSRNKRRSGIRDQRWLQSAMSSSCGGQIVRKTTLRSRSCRRCLTTAQDLHPTTGSMKSGANGSIALAPPRARALSPRVRPQEEARVERALRARIKVALDEAGISVPSA